MKSLYIAIAFSFLAAGCSSANLDQEHANYIESYGWTVGKVLEKEEYKLPKSEELLMFLGEQGLDVEELKQQKTIYLQVIRLKEKCRGRLNAFLYTNQDNEIIGAQLHIEEANPGVSKLVEKETFLKRCR